MWNNLPGRLPRETSERAGRRQALSASCRTGAPRLKRQPLKKQTADPERLLDLLHRWRDEAVGAGHAINRIALTFEPGRDVCCWPKAAELSDATRSSAIWGTVLPT